MNAMDFHVHLDGCPQCRNYPANLCPVGLSLLHKATGSLGLRIIKYEYLAPNTVMCSPDVYDQIKRIIEENR